jgi:hypothetical protein
VDQIELLLEGLDIAGDVHEDRGDEDAADELAALADLISTQTR